MIAVVGATGMLGSDVARRLLSAGHHVIAITRSADRAAPLASLGAEVRVADLTNRASLDVALRDATTVFAAAHGILGRGQYVSANVDGAGHRALIDAARGQRVDRFVYTSVLGATPDHPVPFWRTKFQIEQHLQASGLAHVIVRPAAFMDFHAHELIGKPLLSGKPAVILGPGERPLNFVAVRDVGEIAATAVTRPDLRNETIEVGGPDNVSRNDVAALYAERSGRSLRVRHIPLGALRLMSVLLRPVHPGVSGIMHSTVAFESIDQTFDQREMLRRFPIVPTSLDTFVREKVAASLA